MCEKEKMVFTSIFSFSNNVYSSSQNEFQFFSYIKYFILFSANAFDLARPKIFRHLVKS